MLTSITPLGERGRGQYWPVTVVALVVGHIAGGAALGSLMAAAGTIVRLGGAPNPESALVVVALLVVVAAVFDVSGRSLPGRRQVDERWLTTYRGWVYGLGFGAQLGFGLVTVVNTALVVPMFVTGAALPARDAVAIGCVYGAVRGLAAAGGALVRSVAGLRRLHRVLDHTEVATRVVGGTAVAVAVVGLALAA